MKTLRQLAKWAGIVLGVIFAIPIILTMLLYIPPIQNWAVKKAIAISTEATGMNIALGSVGISFPLDIKLEELSARQNQDTIL